MTYKTSFNHGLKLDCPSGVQMKLCACQWHDDPFFMIEDGVLKTWNGPTRLSDPPDKEQVLSTGTVVRLWDEDAGDPVLGTI